MTLTLNLRWPAVLAMNLQNDIVNATRVAPQDGLAAATCLTYLARARARGF